MGFCGVRGFMVDGFRWSIRFVVKWFQWWNDFGGRCVLMMLVLCGEQVSWQVGFVVNVFRWWTDFMVTGRRSEWVLLMSNLIGSVVNGFWWWISFVMNVFCGERVSWLWASLWYGLVVDGFLSWRVFVVDGLVKAWWSLSLVFIWGLNNCNRLWS